ncbi:MAG TPA: hypothetical protein VK837_10070 [Longimicrobiales bacterium]|nr:hypothetical protein [Longimicrobiales bacterium]
MSRTLGANPGFLVPTLLALMATACDAPDPTAPLATDRGRFAPAQAQVARPFRLRADAALLAVDFAPDFGPPLFGKSDFGGRCSMPSDFVVSFALEGQATHLGRFAGVAEHCSQIDFATGNTSVISDGELILTAANGDELWTNYVRFGLGEEVPEDHVFVGGTGRFAGASGGGPGRPDCDRATGLCTFTLDGVIAYAASAASD